MSNKLNKNLSVISPKPLVEWIGILPFLFLQKVGYGEKFIRTIQVTYNNIQSKIRINGLLSDTFTLMQGVCQRFPLSSVLYYIRADDVLVKFIDADKRIKGVQIGDHEIKLVNFADDITIFLGDITCLNRIQVILKLYE